MPNTTDLKELGEFLKHLRQRCINEHPHRRHQRTPGLRREDVAQRVGVSTDTYTRIEQGKYHSLTLLMLKDILVALNATPDEMICANHLSGLVLLSTCHSNETSMTPSLQRMLDGYDPKPAYVMNKYWDIIGYNRAAPIAFPMIQRLDDAHTSYDPTNFARNVVYFMFVNPLSRQIIVEWEGHVQRIIKEFRMEYAQHRKDPVFITLIEVLKQRSELFRTWWETPNVTRKIPLQKEVNHPAIGRLLFEQTGYHPTHAPDLQLVFYTPLDKETEEKLFRLHQEGYTISDAA